MISYHEVPSEKCYFLLFVLAIPIDYTASMKLSLKVFKPVWAIDSSLWIKSSVVSSTVTFTSTG